jgi:hypothetical protein
LAAGACNRHQQPFFLVGPGARRCPIRCPPVTPAPAGLADVPRVSRPSFPPALCPPCADDACLRPVSRAQLRAWPGQRPGLACPAWMSAWTLGSTGQSLWVKATLVKKVLASILNSRKFQKSMQTCIHHRIFPIYQKKCV